jgi:lysophospholipid acyltransferase (LPLAT)-like uncharacterized protein
MIKILLGNLLYLVLIIFHKTIRLKIVNTSKQKIFEKQNYIFAIWHQNTFSPFYAYRNKNIAMLVSANQKGAILGLAAKKLGYDIIQADETSTRSTLNLSKKLKAGQNIVMAVDGPNGPSRVIKDGSKYLTDKTTVQTIPIKVNYSFALPLFWRWDKYYLPLPFSKVTLYFSPPYSSDSNWEGLANDL